MDVHMFSGSGFAWRVLLALELKGQRYAELLLPAAQAALKAPAFLALNPRGKVPVLRDGEYVLPESVAILAYLERKFPDPPLFGRSPEEAGLIWQAILDFDLYVSAAWVSGIIGPIFSGKAASAGDTIRAAAEAARGELAKLETAVSKSGWIAGTALTAADIAVLPLLEALLRAAGKPDAKPLDLAFLPFAPRYPALAAWRKKLQALPAYTRTYPAYWKKLDAA